MPIWTCMQSRYVVVLIPNKFQYKKFLLRFCWINHNLNCISVWLETQIVVFYFQFPLIHFSFSLLCSTKQQSTTCSNIIAVCFVSKGFFFFQVSISALFFIFHLKSCNRTHTNTPIKAWKVLFFSFAFGLNTKNHLVMYGKNIC